MISWNFVESVVSDFRTCIPIEGDRREWCVNKRAIAWERPLSKRDLEALGLNAPEGEVMAVHVADLISRNAWLEVDPDAFFVSKHFANYPAVLVDMSKANPDVVRELLVDTYEYLSAR